MPAADANAYEKPHCILCGESRTVFRFSKPSGEGELFNLVSCARCGLRFVSPRPDESAIGRYYKDTYFTRRTDRGYDNYFSPEIRAEIERVMLLNLADLGFFEYERSLPAGRSSLDIGCAAGYFVNLMKSRGWDSYGIDIAESCTSFARDSLGLPVRSGNYLEERFGRQFDLITLWATVEHLHHPERVLEKAFSDLNKGGYLYLSTCRAGGINFMRLFGPSWRFYNFPEHLYYFSRRNITSLLSGIGFIPCRYRTYGSGFGRAGGRVRRIADYLAKHLYAGDMMILAARKP